MAKPTEGATLPTYDLDPDGNVTFTVHNVPPYLPAQLQDIPLEVLEGKTISPHLSSDNPRLTVRASSKHLALASPYYARMFKSQFREGDTLRKTGHIKLEVTDFNGLGFLLLMLIIHGRTTRVPRAITRDLLKDIAVLVDYFECYAAVKLYGDMWIATLPDDLGYVADPIGWVFIAWVFRRRDIFRRYTQFVVEMSAGTIEAQGLPIPGHIIDKLNESRIEFLQSLIDDLYLVYAEVAAGCRANFHPNEICSCVVLGAMSKRLLQLNILPKPESPFLGLQISHLSKEVHHNMQSPMALGAVSARHEQCRLANRISAMPYYIFEGLDLYDTSLGTIPPRD